MKNNYESYAEAVVKALTEYLNIHYDKATDNYYAVKKGDSLYLIAQANDTTVDEIKRLNNLISNNLSVGQKYYCQEQQ